MKQMMALDVFTVLLAVVMPLSLCSISHPEVITSDGYHIQNFFTQNG
jgi:hypothetical protein